MTASSSAESGANLIFKGPIPIDDCRGFRGKANSSWYGDRDLVMSDALEAQQQGGSH